MTSAKGYSVLQRPDSHKYNLVVIIFYTHFWPATIDWARPRSRAVQTHRAPLHAGGSKHRCPNKNKNEVLWSSRSHLFFLCQTRVFRNNAKSCTEAHSIHMWRRYCESGSRDFALRGIGITRVHRTPLQASPVQKPKIQVLYICTYAHIKNPSNKETPRTELASTERYVGLKEDSGQRKDRGVAGPSSHVIIIIKSGGRNVFMRCDCWSHLHLILLANPQCQCYIII